MKTDGFKRAVVLGLAASALLLAGGCREDRARQGTQDVQGQQQQAPGTGGAGRQEDTGPGQEPRDLNQLPEEEGFQSVPEEQKAPSGIGLDGRGGAGGEQQGERQPAELNQLPDEEGFQSVPEEQEAPSGIGLDGRGGSGGEQQEGQQPADLNQLPDEEGFQSVPDEQEGRSGIKLDGRGGAGEEHPKPDDAR